MATAGGRSCRFGSPTWARPAATVAARRPVLGARPVILRLAPKTAELIGETTAEWRLLEKQRDPSLDVAELAETLAEALLPVRRDRQGVQPADGTPCPAAAAPRRRRRGNAMNGALARSGAWARTCDRPSRRPSPKVDSRSRYTL